MAKCLALLLPLLLAPTHSCVPGPISISAADSQGLHCSVADSVESAIAAFSDFSKIEIDLRAPETEVFTWNSRAAISNSVAIIGSGNQVVLAGKVTVAAGGQLRLKRLMVTSQTAGINGLFTVEGEMRLEEVVLHSVNGTAFLLFGLLDLLQTSVSRCEGLLISVQSRTATLSIANSTVRQTAGSVVSIDSVPSATVSVFNSLFISNSAVLLSVRGSVPLAFGSFRNCTIEGNTGGLVHISGSGVNLQFDDCTFRNNSGPGFVLSLVGGSVAAGNCVWDGNAGAIVSVQRLEGSLAIANSSVSHCGSGPLALTNSGDAELCQVLISQVSFADYSFSTMERSAGVMLAVQCSVLLRDIEVTRVNATGLFYRLNGLLELRSSYCQMRSVTIADSLSSQAILFVTQSLLVADGLVLRGVASGLNSLFIFTVNVHVAISGLAVSDAVGISTSDAISVSEKSLLYFASTLTPLVIKDAVVGPGQLHSLCAQMFSSFSLSNITLLGPQSNHPLIAGQGMNFSIENVRVVNAKTLLFFEGHRSNMSISGLRMYDSTVQWVFSCSSGSHCVVADSVFEGVTAMAVVSAMNSVFELQFAEIRKCNFQRLIKGFAEAKISIANSGVRDCTTAITFIYKGQLAINNTTFSAISSSLILFTGIMSDVKLTNVSLIDTWRTVQLGTFADSSSLSLSFCTVFNVSAASNIGFQLTESEAKVDRSVFEQFSMTLFTGKSAVFLISNSQFAHGGPVSTNVRYKGAVLSCSNCQTVKFTNSTIADTDCYQGSVFLQSSALEVVNSKFDGNHATVAGAIALVDSEYRLSDSLFTSNAARSTGGAIDVFITTGNSHISDCLFYNNSAHEGGAMKYHRDSPRLIRVQFLNNAADYGPDIATFGVAAGVRHRLENENLASGQLLPVPFVVDFYDHFGQIVVLNDHAELSFAESNEVAYQGTSNTIIANGVFNLSNAGFLARPGSSASITVQVNDRSQGFTVHTELSLQLSFRQCVLGEVALPDRCVYCTTGFYALSLASPNCSYCPPHVFCPGGSGFQVDAGYWRASESTAEVYSCPLYAKCNGGQNSDCESGYTGKVCAQCSEGWYRVGTLHCDQCKLWKTTVLLALYIVQVATCFVAAYYVSEVLCDSTKSALVGVWVEHSQLAAIVLRLRSELPPVAITVYQSAVYLWSLSLNSVPLQCVFPSANDAGMKLYAGALLLAAVPCAYITMGAARLVAITRKRLLRFLFTVTYLLGPVLAEAGFALVPSAQLEGQRWLLADPSMEAWGDSHSRLIKALALPLAVLIVFPLFLYGLCAALNRREVLCEYFGFLSQGGRVAQGAKLSFIALRLAYIGLVVAATSRRQLFQVALGQSLLALLTILHALLRPHITHPFYWLSAYSQVTTFAGVCVAGYYIELSQETVSGVSFSLGLAVLNAGFYVACGLCLLMREKPLSTKVVPQLALESEAPSPACDLIAPCSSFILPPEKQLTFGEAAARASPKLVE